MTFCRIEGANYIGGSTLFVGDVFGAGYTAHGHQAYIPLGWDEETVATQCAKVCSSLPDCVGVQLYFAEPQREKPGSRVPNMCIFRTSNLSKKSPCHRARGCTALFFAKLGTFAGNVGETSCYAWAG